MVQITVTFQEDCIVLSDGTNTRRIATAAVNGINMDAHSAYSMLTDGVNAVDKTTGALSPDWYVMGVDGVANFSPYQ